MQACPANGYSQQFTFVRPSEVPGRELDVQVALELQRNALLERQANSQRFSEALKAVNDAVDAVKGRSTPSDTKKTTCQTRAIGSALQTNCW